MMWSSETSPAVPTNDLSPLAPPLQRIGLEAPDFTRCIEWGSAWIVIANRPIPDEERRTTPFCLVVIEGSKIVSCEELGVFAFAEIHWAASGTLAISLQSWNQYNVWTNTSRRETRIYRVDV